MIYLPFFYLNMYWLCANVNIKIFIIMFDEYFGHLVNSNIAHRKFYEI